MHRFPTVVLETPLCCTFMFFFPPALTHPLGWIRYVKAEMSITGSFQDQSWERVLWRDVSVDVQVSSSSVFTPTLGWMELSMVLKHFQSKINGPFSWLQVFILRTKLHASILHFIYMKIACSLGHLLSLYPCSPKQWGKSYLDINFFFLLIKHLNNDGHATLLKMLDHSKRKWKQR